MNEATRPKLLGKAAVISGASQGLGREIARRFLAEGANVTICARDETLLSATADALASEFGRERVTALPADISDENDVSDLISAAIERFGGLDILVNNAGVQGPMGPTETVDVGEWKRALEINVMSALLPSRAAIPHLRARGKGKIINLSGGGATQPMPRISAYAAGKAAVVRLTETLAHELARDRIDVNAVAPGALNTRILSQVLEAGPAGVGQAYYSKAVAQRDNGGQSVDKGAGLCVFLGSDESDGITGRLISAQWDPWPRLGERVGRLSESDIYTLRRIVPEDRGEEPWGLP